MKYVILILMAALALSGCASKTDEITAANLSNGQYSNYSCRQIKQKVYVVNHELQELSVKQNKTSSKSSWAPAL